jgi:hypothetical protein
MAAPPQHNPKLTTLTYTMDRVQFWSAIHPKPAFKCAHVAYLAGKRHR